MAHPVTWFQIQGKDGKALHAFYAKVFGWKMTAAPGSMVDTMMVAPEPPDGIAGGVGASMDGRPNVSVYVNVDDLYAHLDKIEAAGGRTAMPPMDLPNGMGSIAGFLDPAGNWVGLWVPPAKAAAQEATPKRAPAKKAPAKKATPKKAPAKKAPAKKAKRK